MALDKYRVYIDSTIPSYLVARPSRVPLANPRTRPKIEQVCRDAGYSPPRIESPKAILEELS